jgi:hypothetical protein
MNKDFKDFKEAQTKAPPVHLEEHVLKTIAEKIDPPHTLIFLKLVGIQAIIGVITMVFCPQFNYSLTNNYELFHMIHHKFGHYPCMAICGAIFMGSGALVASFILEAEERVKIQHNNFLYYCALSMVALGSFFSLGAQMYLDLSAIWLAGATLSGVVIYQAPKLLKFNFSSELS